MNYIVKRMVAPGARGKILYYVHYSFSRDVERSENPGVTVVIRWA